MFRIAPGKNRFHGCYWQHPVAAACASDSSHEKITCAFTGDATWERQPGCSAVADSCRIIGKN